jgi:hypothetical protein
MIFYAVGGKCVFVGHRSDVEGGMAGDKSDKSGE